MKRQNQAVPCIMKKLRSSIPRRRRSQISPILCSSLSSAITGTISSSYLTEEVSCDSSVFSVTKSKASLKKRGCEEMIDAGVAEKFEGSELRRITRSYYTKKADDGTKEKEKDVRVAEVEVSESSCVESCSGVTAGENNLKLKFKLGKGIENVMTVKGLERSEEITLSEVSCAKQSPGLSLKSGGQILEGIESASENRENEVISLIQLLESPSEANFEDAFSDANKLSDKLIEDGKNRVSGDDASEDTRNFAESNFTVSKSGTTTDRMHELVSLDCDLTCSEHLSCEDECDYSSAYSDLPDSSYLDFSEYTPSIWYESGSQFSERSEGTSPSHTFQLLIEYTQQFYRSTYNIHSNIPSRMEEEYADRIELRFEDAEHEESYQMMRNRERRQVYLHDYAKEYCTSTEYGDLIIQQRSHMVHWIVEHSTNKEFQNETMFLGVSLLDRFLSCGYFTNKKNLQLAGIACLSLATRIEENQPFNSIKQKSFYIESNIYSRCEVVAMEWLVQKVLKFQCFLPTMYNFLWYYLKAAKADEAVEKTAKHLAVLALSGHKQLSFWPSTVAAGVVIIASLAANQYASCHLVAETHVRTKDDQLHGCIKSMEWLIKYIC